MNHVKQLPAQLLVPLPLPLSLLQLGRLSAMEAELNGVTLRLQRCDEDRKEREVEAQDQKNQVSWTHLDSLAAVTHSRGGRDSALLCPQVERLQRALHSLEEEAELLRSKLSSVNQEKVGHAQEVRCLQRELLDAEKKVSNGRASASPSHHQRLHTTTPSPGRWSSWRPAAGSC